MHLSMVSAFYKDLEVTRDVLRQGWLGEANDMEAL